MRAIDWVTIAFSFRIVSSPWCDIVVAVRGKSSHDPPRAVVVVVSFRLVPFRLVSFRLVSSRWCDIFVVVVVGGKAHDQHRVYGLTSFKVVTRALPGFTQEKKLIGHVVVQGCLPGFTETNVDIIWVQIVRHTGHSP
jgi:hypothetical protein